jgi:hypothetical protein
MTHVAESLRIKRTDAKTPRALRTSNVMKVFFALLRITLHPEQLRIKFFHIKAQYPCAFSGKNASKPA